MESGKWKTGNHPRGEICLERNTSNGIAPEGRKLGRTRNVERKTPRRGESSVGQERIGGESPRRGDISIAGGVNPRNVDNGDEITKKNCRE